MPPPPVIPIRERPSALVTRLNLVANDANLYTESLRAPGYSDSTGNRDLAGIGDSLLRQFYQIEGRTRRKSRGAIQDIVGRLASNNNLAARGFALGIDRYILNNPSNQGAVPISLMATTMEAILGAVFLDNGESLAAVKLVIIQFGLGWPE
ncbi:RNAse III [Aspergillus ustus]|uniref:RNAse III n=1 Tax=Aspergillus ustus TaxID=40382 RepID=A0A0C1E6E2_ASPUT|nr:RNAse III [Aspergillus ustus]